MIRAVAITSLIALLGLVLYLPSALPPQHFMALLRMEHTQLVAFWQATHAERVLSRTIEAQTSAQDVAPASRAQRLSQTGTVDSAVGFEMSAVNARLFNNAYFRSVEALLVLATHRFFLLLEWTPWLTPLGLAAIIDAGAARSIKAKSLAPHNPEAFAACVVGAILTACGAMVALVAPFTLPPLVFPALPLALVLLVTGALRHYHQRG